MIGGNTLKVIDNRKVVSGRPAQLGDVIKAIWRDTPNNDPTYYLIVATDCGEYNAVTLAAGRRVGKPQKSVEDVMQRIAEYYDYEIIDPSRVSVVIE